MQVERHPPEGRIGALATARVPICAAGAAPDCAPGMTALDAARAAAAAPAAAPAGVLLPEGWPATGPCCEALAPATIAACPPSLPALGHAALMTLAST